jgi:hypothetical protein
VYRESPTEGEQAPLPPRAIERVSVTLSADPVPVTLRATLTRAVPAGTRTRQKASPAGQDGGQPVTDRFGFRPVAGPPERLEAVVRPDGAVAARLYDHWHNPAGVPEGVRVHALCDAGGRMKVRDAAGRQTVSPPGPRWSPEGERLLFGEFRWHTEGAGDGASPSHSDFGLLRERRFPRVGLDQSFRLHRRLASFLEEVIYR